MPALKQKLDTDRLMRWMVRTGWYDVHLHDGSVYGSFDQPNGPLRESTINVLINDVSCWVDCSTGPGDIPWPVDLWDDPLLALRAEAEECIRIVTES